ncbi:MAG: UvrD-helicase domain-containing protein [Acidimicrobiales bacterium]
MSDSISTTDPSAERQSEIAQASVIACLREGRNFRLEAGAGAGKTTSLIQSLAHILENRDALLPLPYQRVACLTYTNAAKNEIVRRTDGSPTVFCDTLHGFLWEMIRPFQAQLREELLCLESWTEILDGRDTLGRLSIEYDLGHRKIGEETVFLHHDDVPVLACSLFMKLKFRAIIADKFPIFLIDEYQDTAEGLVQAMMSGVGFDDRTPIFGFFGDHWQQIYDKTCGLIEHPSITPIDKHANFRSARSVVNFLNCLRSELPQAPIEAATNGSVTIYHSNNWPGVRLDRSWKGQISHEASHASLEWAIADAIAHRWENSSPDTKVLMLTHSALAIEMGYESLPKVFRYNDAFAKKADDLIAYFIDEFEPAIASYRARRYGAMFDAIGSKRPLLRSQRDKSSWIELFDRLVTLRESGTVGEVLDALLDQDLFGIPDRLGRRQRELEEARSRGDDEIPPNLSELDKVRDVRYGEIVALSGYLADQTLFSTKHNVKGAEFDNVVAVIGRGWSAYNFSKMLDQLPKSANFDGAERKSFERSRNLFYVACSRAKFNLVLLITQELSEATLKMLEEWVGKESVIALKYSDENACA